MRAILFDLDGTLVDSERQCAESVARALSRFGRVVSEADRAFVIGRGWSEIYAHLSLAGPLPLSRDALIALAGREREQIVEEEGLTILPGALELVRAAAAAGLPITIVSGSSRGEIAAVARRLGIEALVPHYVGAEDVARGKPAPDGFLLGAERLGVDPEHVLVLEDSAAGIAAARAAGMSVVAIRIGNFAGQDQTAADLVIETLAEIDLAGLSSLHRATHLRNKAQRERGAGNKAGP